MRSLKEIICLLVVEWPLFSAAQLKNIYKNPSTHLLIHLPQARSEPNERGAISSQPLGLERPKQDLRRTYNDWHMRDHSRDEGIQQELSVRQEG